MSEISLLRSGRRRRFEDIDIYPVISSEYTNNRNILDVLQMVADGGAKIVQLREKNRTVKEVFQIATEYRKITDKYQMLLIIDDYADIAAATGADGVHLGQDDFPLFAARQLYPDLLIGSSTHNLPEAEDAVRSGCDYLNIGPIYATGTKLLAMEPLGLENLDKIKKAATIPFTVMGGIKMRHLPLLAAHGADKIAMVTEITMAENIEQTVRTLRTEILKSR